MDDRRPRALEVYLGNFGGASYGVWWDGDRRQIAVSPSAAQWHRFWETMDGIDVWSWGSHYYPDARLEPAEQVRDGTHWSLTLESGDRRVESSGDGRGPGSADLDASQPFDAFTEAVSRLVGGHPFA